MNALEETKERERRARLHGRHITLEQELNRIGLSLFASPFGTLEEAERVVMFNEWEGVQTPSTHYIIVDHDGGVIHRVKGIPPHTILEFRDSDVEDLEPEDIETVDGMGYHIIRFADDDED